MPLARQGWATLTITQKAAWNSAGALNGMSGYKMFWRDLAGRRKNGLTGYSTPSDLYQVWVGRVTIASPSTSIKLAQYHPFQYYISRKVRGTRSQREPIEIIESFDLPLEIALSYKTDLQSVGSATLVQFYCIVISHYQGKDIETRVTIDMPLQQNWTRATATLSQVLGRVKGYTAYIEIQDARGDLFFDNVELNHSGQNWARDRNCKDINEGFNTVYRQVPKHWVLVGTAGNVEYESYYYNLLE